LNTQSVHKAALQIFKGRIAVVSNNEMRADSDIRRPVIESLMSGTERRVSPRTASNDKRTVLCETQGAMSLQSSDAARGHESTPQKLLQLVGYRDPHAAYSWHRPRRNGTG
jgi:hypothetical protein